MTEKINWYKEVLELEPNSRLFLPLARMLARENDVDGAIATLENGLGRHVEYLEARLLLIELLYKTGRKEKCDEQVEILSRMFSSYAGFWQAWAACLASRPNESDTASVLRFLAMQFLNGPTSLAAVIDRGVKAMLDDVKTGEADKTEAATAAPTRPLESADTQTEITVETRDAAPKNDDLPAIEETSAELVEETEPKEKIAADEFANVTPENDANVASAPGRPYITDFGEEENAFETDERDSESFSLRTRSMADVLAAQGDIQGALDIYLELQAGAEGAEAEELAARVEELTALAAEPKTEPVVPKDDTSKNKLITMLETLARRVEARASAPI